jgi:hypothetical protein
MRRAHLSRLRRDGENEVEAADAHWRARDASESGLLEQRHDVMRVGVAMAMEMRKKS